MTLGLAIFEEGVVVKSKEWLFEPILDWRGNLRFDYSAAAAEIHGKTLQEMREHGQSCAEVYREVRDFLGSTWSHPIVSHNAPFDSEVWSTFLYVLAQWDRNHQGMALVSELLTGPWLDTKRIAQARFSPPYDIPDLKLDTLCRYFEIGAQGDVHGAEQDAILAGELYFKLRPLKVPA
ncbi:MAG: 3'-5' exonuclease [Armatimonadetes bacterium]|nr:3'-5' exonuclease [Armatimonadota bacterium]